MFIHAILDTKLFCIQNSTYKPKVFRIIKELKINLKMQLLTKLFFKTKNSSKKILFCQYYKIFLLI